MAEIRGRCLCGEVTVRAEVTQPVLRACHCDMCRQHTSGIFFSVDTAQCSPPEDGGQGRRRASICSHEQGDTKFMTTLRSVPSHREPQRERSATRSLTYRNHLDVRANGDPPGWRQ